MIWIGSFPIWPKPPPRLLLLRLLAFIFPCICGIIDDTFADKRIVDNGRSGVTIMLKLLLACGVLLLLVGCVAKRAAPPPQTTMFNSSITNIKRSVFPIVCVQPPAQLPGEDIVRSIEGTAFFVRQDGTFATAGHVIRDLTAPNRAVPCEQPAFYLPVQDWNRAATFRATTFRFAQEACRVNEQLDVAICRWNGPQVGPGSMNDRMGRSPNVVTLETVLQDDGVAIAFTGFPLQAVAPLTSVGVVAAYRNIPADGEPREIVIDKIAWPGASGSPIYLSNGRVVGIILQRGVGESVGIAVGRPAVFIQRLLADYQAAQ